MSLIFSRFVFVSWILLQVGGVKIINDSRIQVLLSNSSFSVDNLVYRGKIAGEPDELPTPRICKKLISEWFENLSQLKNGGKCGKPEECLDALDQLDAFARFPAPGSPNIYDGSFRKCNELNDRGRHRRKYCYLIQTDEKMNCREEYHSVLFHPNRTAFGICGPEDCHGKDYASIFGGMKQKPFHFMMDRPVCAVFCTVREIPKRNMFYVFTSFMILLVSIVFFSSLYDYIRDTRYRLSSDTEKVFGQRAILSFSLWSNIEFLFQENRHGYIKCLDCLRSITFTWIVGQNVVGHLAFYDKELRATPSKISLSSSALSSLIPIYTYIFISGLTVSYAFIRANPSPKIIKRPITWLVFYFHRWIRLTSALMVFIGFFDAYGKYIQGPYDALTGYSMVTQTDQCTYWKDIIHVSNFVAVDEMCYLPAWHLAVDFQFTLVAPLFLIAFYYSAKMGITLAVIASLAGSGFTIYFFLNNNILHSAFTGDHVFDDKLVELILSKPWNQMAPYMIGMIVGYFLAEKAGSRRIIHPVASAIIWVVVSILAVSALMFGNVGTSQLQRAMANVFSRAVWCICLAWIIVSTEMKWAGPIGHFMEHPFWRPFGKLSYCAFIVHHMAVYFLFNMEEQAPRYVSFWHEYFHYTVPIVIYSYFVAFFLSLIVEIPMIRLNKMLLDKFIPASKIEDKEDISKSEKENEEDSDDSLKEGLKEESSSEKSEKNQKSKRKPVDERSLEDQGENEMSEEWNAMDEPLLERDYY